MLASAVLSRKICTGLIALFTLVFCAGATHAAWYSDKQSIMGTEINIILWLEQEAKAKQAIADVMAEMHRIDQTFSPYKDTSDLAKLNASAAKAPVKVSPELKMLVDKSLFFSRVSEGAFDITFASVGWYYDYRDNKKPSDEKLAELLPAINYKQLKLNRAESTLFYGHKNIRIDLGGIAKGHAVDKAAEILTKYGVKHASISAGGDSRIIGDRKGRPWIVGIKNPRAPKGQAESVIRLPLQDVAVSTSGDYERYFIDPKTGERIHHILNPKTGKPAGEVVSVTILGPNGLDTDPLSTTVFVLGVQKGLELVNRLPGIDCVIIDRHGKVHYSDELMPAN